MEAEARDILARACSGEYDAVEGSSQVRDAGATDPVIPLDPRLAETARDYARRHHTTLEDLDRQLLDRELGAEGTAWADDLFARMDEAGGDSGGATWARDDLYRA